MLAQIFGCLFANRTFPYKLLQSNKWQTGPSICSERKKTTNCPFSGLQCKFNRIIVHAGPTKNRDLGTFCGTLPLFYLYSFSSKMSFSFLQKFSETSAYVAGLFQVIDRNTVQTKAQTWGNKNYFVVFKRSDTLHFHPVNNAVESPFLKVFEWIVFTEPGSRIKAQMKLECLDKKDMEVFVRLGYSSYSNFANSYKCHNTSEAKYNKVFETFLLTISAFVWDKGKHFGRLIEAKFFMTSEVPLFEYHVNEDNEMLFSNNSYKMLGFVTNRTSFIEVQITQRSPIRYTFHLCGAFGVYIIEKINSTRMTYGPYCNLTEFDALSGEKFSFYSHGENLQIVLYHFNPILQPDFNIRLKVFKTKCQGIVNICFLFSRLTPERYDGMNQITGHRITFPQRRLFPNKVSLALTKAVCLFL